MRSNLQYSTMDDIAKEHNRLRTVVYKFFTDKNDAFWQVTAYTSKARTMRLTCSVNAELANDFVKQYINGLEKLLLTVLEEIPLAGKRDMAQILLALSRGVSTISAVKPGLKVA